MKDCIRMGHYYRELCRVQLDIHTPEMAAHDKAGQSPCSDLSVDDLYIELKHDIDLD